MVIFAKTKQQKKSKPNHYPSSTTNPKWSNQWKIQKNNPPWVPEVTLFAFFSKYKAQSNRESPFSGWRLKSRSSPTASQLQGQSSTKLYPKLGKLFKKSRRNLEKTWKSFSSPLFTTSYKCQSPNRGLQVSLTLQPTVTLLLQPLHQCWQCCTH